MSILMLQRHMTKIITNQKDKKFVSLFSNPIKEKNSCISWNRFSWFIHGKA